MLTDLLDLTSQLSPAAWFFAVAFFAWIEYVFPPFPGDTLLLLGFFLAGQGAAPAPELFLCAVVGSSLGAATAYRMGERWGEAILDRMARRPRARRWRRRLEELLDRHALAALLANRFLPGVRNFMLYGAGSVRLPFVPTLVASSLSSVGFVALLAFVGAAGAGSWAEAMQLYKELSRALAVCIAIGAVAWLLVVARRDRRSSDGLTPERMRDTAVPADRS